MESSTAKAKGTLVFPRRITDIGDLERHRDPQGKQLLHRDAEPSARLHRRLWINEGPIELEVRPAPESRCGEVEGTGAGAEKDACAVDEKAMLGEIILHLLLI